MKHSEFKEAAKRHLIVCHHLLNNFDNFQGNEIVESHQKKILLNIYYLSGYALECILKHLICTHSHLSASDMNEPLPPKNSELKKIKIGQSNISYEKLHSHSLQALSAHAASQSVSSDLLPPTVFKKKNLSFYKNWNSEVRYCLSYAKGITDEDITQQNMVNYLEAIKLLIKQANLQ